MPGGMVGIPGDGGNARSRRQAFLCRYLRALGTKVETRAPGALLWVQLGPPPHASESGGAVTPPSLRGWRTSSRTQHSRVTPSPTLPGSLSHLCSGVTSCATPMHTDLSGDCSPRCRRVDCSGGCCAARLGRAQLSSGRRGSVSRHGWSRRPHQKSAAVWGRCTQGLWAASPTLWLPRCHFCGPSGTGTHPCTLGLVGPGRGMS